VLAVVDGKKVPVPFNLNALYAVFPPRHASIGTLLLVDIEVKSSTGKHPLKQRS